MASPASQTAEADLCPFHTADEWQEFLEHYADEPNWVATCEDSTCNADFYEFVKDNVQRVFEQCASFIDSHAEIARCTENMRRFTPMWLKQHDAVSYGFIPDNHAYIAAQNAPEKPADLLKIPDAIVAAMPDRRRVEIAARDNGYKYLTHDSALGGSRTFIFIPDPQGRFDRWMLLNLADGKNSKVIKSGQPLSIMAVEKKDEFGRDLPQVRLQFRDYTITPLPKGYAQRFRLSVHEDNNGKCFSCHSNGVRQLIARRTPILSAEPVKGEDVTDVHDFAYRRLQEFNRKLRSYGTADWTGMIDPRALGPALGKQQGCMDCHDGKSRGTLTVFTSHAQVERKMVRELSMPPDTFLPRLIERQELKNPDFSREEAAALKEATGMHAALLRGFENSRLPALEEWFLETSCRGSKK